MKTSLIIDALEMAIKNRNPPKGLFFHSDRGVQYASNSFKELLQKNNMIQSMSRKGNCTNAFKMLVICFRNVSTHKYMGV